MSRPSERIQRLGKTLYDVSMEMLKDVTLPPLDREELATWTDEAGHYLTSALADPDKLRKELIYHAAWLLVHAAGITPSRLETSREESNGGIEDSVNEQCLCNIGVQECPSHPGRLRTQEEKIQFRLDFDRRYQAGLDRQKRKN